MHRVGINENIFIDIVLMLYQPTRSTYIFKGDSNLNDKYVLSERAL